MGWRRSRKCASRTLGKASRSSAQAAAKPGKIAVRKGEHQHVSRWLAQIDGLDDLVEASRAGCEQMHCSNAQ